MHRQDYPRQRAIRALLPAPTASAGGRSGRDQGGRAARPEEARHHARGPAQLASPRPRAAAAHHRCTVRRRDRAAGGSPRRLVHLGPVRAGPRRLRAAVREQGGGRCAHCVGGVDSDAGPYGEVARRRVRGGRRLGACGRWGAADAARRRRVVADARRVLHRPC